MHALSGRMAKRARRRTPAVPSGVIWVIDARLGTVHLVTDETMAAGGCHVALCGREVLPASPTARERRSCVSCVAWFAAWRYRLVDRWSAAG